MTGFVLNADDDHVRRMRRRCSGGVVWFSQPPGTKVREFVEDYRRRGGRAVVLEHTDKGDMIVIKHGRRSMQLAWTCPPPSTFGGTAQRRQRDGRAGAASPLAPAPARDPPGPAHLRDLVLPLLFPGRMNQVNVNNIDVFVDYCC